MHTVIPLFGFLLLAFLGLIVYFWCYLCYRFGAWLVSGCCGTRQPQPVSRCAPRRSIPEAAAPSPASPPRCGWGRRCDKPSFSVGLILILLLSCLAVFGLNKQRHVHRYFSKHYPLASSKPAQPNSEDKAAVLTASAHGESAKDAEQLAREEAYGKVVNYVERELPAPRWVPSREYAYRDIIKPNPPEKKGDDYKVTCQIEISPEKQLDLIRRGRMLFLLKLLIAALVLLGTVALYIRMDEYSKGYYTGWLRLAAVSVGVAVLFGLVQAGVVSFDWPSPGEDVDTPHPPAGDVRAP